MKFLDIYNQDKIIIEKIIKDFKRNITKGDFILGKTVKDFERKMLSIIDQFHHHSQNCLKDQEDLSRICGVFLKLQFS